MTGLRFDFQSECVTCALDELTGLALNIGANDDPAHLKQLDPDRVVNCDLFATDQVLDRPNMVDRLFDCARDRWPFEDGEAAIVVLGDIIEHLKPAEIDHALGEARRVTARRRVPRDDWGRLCVTVPEDHRDDVSDLRADMFPRGAVHRTTVTRELLIPILSRASWTVQEWREVEYDSGVFWGKRTMGHFILAR